MDKGADFRQLRVFAQALGNQVFHRFHVVVRGGFQLFHALGVARAEVVDQLVEYVADHTRDRLQLRDLRSRCQELHPAHLDEDAKANQAKLTEDLAQIVELGGVAPVQGRQSGEWRQVHRRQAS